MHHCWSGLKPYQGVPHCSCTWPPPMHLLSGPSPKPVSPQSLSGYPVVLPRTWPPAMHLLSGPSPSYAHAPSHQQCTTYGHAPASRVSPFALAPGHPRCTCCQAPALYTPLHLATSNEFLARVPAPASQACQGAPRCPHTWPPAMQLLSGPSPNQLVRNLYCCPRTWPPAMHLVSGPSPSYAAIRASHRFWTCSQSTIEPSR